MALQSVFAHGLHFGSGITSDSNQDKNHEREETEDGDDLEEGEIADDDEEEQDKTKTKPDDKKEDSKSNGSSTTTTKSAGIDKSDPKLNVNTTAADTRKRDAKRRARKRGSDDEHSENRDTLRKRRRNQDEGDVEDEDMDLMEMMNARGHSPSERERSRFEMGDLDSSDHEGSSPSSMHVSNSSRRSNSRPDRADRLERTDRLERSDRLERLRPGRTSPRRRARGNSRERERERRRVGDRDRDRDRGRPPPKSGSSMSKIKDESICAFYMEGKCSRGSDCPYSHAALPPRKMELCKFYLMDCCAKKEKCLYMHKDFPCKYFHTGKKCRHGADDCKFSHDPLSEATRAILIKHIETAPREILGDFPRLTREETIQAIDSFSPQGNGREKRPHIPSLFELDFRSSASQPTKTESSTKEGNEERNAEDSSSRRAGFYQEASTEGAPAEERSPENSRSIWFGQLRQEDRGPDPYPTDDSKPSVESSSAIGPDAKPQQRTVEEKKPIDYLSTLPRRQRELFLRIQQQQREPAALDADRTDADEDKPSDEKWYSSDEEGEGRSLTDIIKSIKQKPETHSKTSNASEADSKGTTNLNLGSLDNINVAEIAKALSTLQSKSTLLPTPTPAIASSPEEPTAETGRRDPRIRSNMRARSSGPTASAMGDVDLRMQSRQDVDLRIGNAINSDVDLRNNASVHPASVLAPLGSLEEIGSTDIDLRRFGLPFKPVLTLTPAREIDASFNSHPPIEYHVHVVDCEPLNYGLIRIHADWAHLDPRLQKDHTSERASYSVSDTVSIPLGPASPDPVIPNRLLHYGEVEPAPAFSANRWTPGDPRTRDPRRAAASSVAATPIASSSPGHGVSSSSIADPRGKPGLLGAAPPGMMPYGSKIEGSNEAPTYNVSGGGFRQTSNIPYDRVYEGGGGPVSGINSSPHGVAAIGADQQSPRAENRRDPRQRMRNMPPVAIDPDSRSYTPPLPNERVFR